MKQLVYSLLFISTSIACDTVQWTQYDRFTERSAFHVISQDGMNPGFTLGSKPFGSVYGSWMMVQVLHIDDKDFKFNFENYVDSEKNKIKIDDPRWIKISL